MDTPEPIVKRTSIPTRLSAPSGPVPSPLPPAAAPPPSDFEAPPLRRRPGRLALRALRRYWLWILVLWLLGTIGLAALVRAQARPLYEATAWLRVDAAADRPAGDLDVFLRTQVELLTSPAVLGKALAAPEVQRLPWIARAADPQARIAEALRVAVRPGTSLILISAFSADRRHGAQIVDAVVQAYLETAAAWADQAVAERAHQLEALRRRYRGEIDQRRRELERLAERFAGAAPGGAPGPEATRYQQYHARLGAVELERIEAETVLETLRAGGGRAPTAPPTGAELDRRVEQAFRADPEVAALHAELRQAQAELRDAERRSTDADNADDVARLRQRVEALQEDNGRLWGARLPALRARVAAGEDVAADADAEAQAAEARLDRLRAEQDRLQAEVAAIRQRSRAEGDEALKAQIAMSELTAATELDHRVALMLDQLHAEARGPGRISRLGPARPAPRPTNDRRAVLFAAAPLALALALVALFTLVESRAARIADPDELAARLRLGVLGVVPPLPPPRPSSSAPDSPARRRRVEEFIQSLDHLRVVLDATAPPGGRRCVMITSAMPGEGKTTLAAHLAGRCANAGLSTLLVDADLRRPSLGRLLDVPEGPGLADVLLGEATAEEALMVVGNAGGFHLLPAGGGAGDPSRLLQGDRLGQLVARARATFDVVLIDAPPVLPVPDALLIGRWADGAVMAVRRDASRFPLVERARRRLTTTGVLVLGAVLNGCRPDAATYGAYAHGGDRRDDEGPDPDDDLD